MPTLKTISRLYATSVDIFADILHSGLPCPREGDTLGHSRDDSSIPCEWPLCSFILSSFHCWNLLSFAAHDRDSRDTSEGCDAVVACVGVHILHELSLWLQDSLVSNV